MRAYGQKDGLAHGLRVKGGRAALLALAQEPPYPLRHPPAPPSSLGLPRPSSLPAELLGPRECEEGDGALGAKRAKQRGRRHYWRRHRAVGTQPRPRTHPRSQKTPQQATP
eukprot:scaffold215790_cov29-Tisochrysis_lutea.AAC.4